MKRQAYRAGSFYEAVQSFWLVYAVINIEQTVNPYAFNPGRFDQYMSPYYKKDIDAGTITREAALELVEDLWLKFVVGKHNWATSQMIIVGGQDSRGMDA